MNKILEKWLDAISDTRLEKILTSVWLDPIFACPDKVSYSLLNFPMQNLKGKKVIEAFSNNCQGI